MNYFDDWFVLLMHVISLSMGVLIGYIFWGGGLKDE